MSPLIPASGRNRIPWGALLAVAWLVAVPAVGQDTPTVALRIVTDPAEALVAVNGTPRGRAPLELADLPPGRHLLQVTHPGHRDQFQTVALEAGRPRTVEISLERQRATALVHSDPPGASVALDGAYRGTTPLLLTNIEFGRYRLTVSRPGYQERTLSLDVRNASPQRIDVRLLTDSATLRVTSAPPGAEVLLNGVPRGRTPLVLERIPDGDCVVALRAEGFAPFEQPIRLRAGDDETISVTLQPLPATLRVVSMPEGARVYLDNQFSGETPLDLADLAPGSYRVRVELPAHDPMARTVTLQRAARVVEEFRLIANSGALRVTTAPAGVTVLVDGRVAGETEARPDATDQISEPLTIPQLPVGRREITLTRQGFFEARRTVEIGRDQTTTLDATLRRRFIPDYEVRTETGVYRGVLINITPEFVRIETEIGVIRSFPLGDIRSRRPLREDERVIPEPPADGP